MRWVYELAAACSGLACVGLFVAGRDELDGRRAEARRRARRAGFAACAAGVVQILVAPGLAWNVRPALLLGAAVGASALCAGVALLAGLSGKPRPSCWFAAGAWLLSIALRSC